MNVLDDKAIKLNAAWQVIEETTVSQAISMMFAGAATGMVVDSDNEYYPVSLAEWLKLPVRRGIDKGIHTPKMIIREPHVIIAVNYSKVQRKRPQLNLRGVATRDGKKCAYTGKVLSPSEMTIDHVIPRSRGGKHEWKNVVLADKVINNKKSNKTPEEAGLKLLKQPKAPLPAVPESFLHASHPDHEIFLKK